MPIGFAQAALGATIKVPSLDGERDLDIPAGTQTGETFVLKGAGFPRPRRTGRGDEIVQVVVVTSTRSPTVAELRRSVSRVASYCFAVFHAPVAVLSSSKMRVASGPPYAQNPKNRLLVSRSTFEYFGVSPRSES